MVAEALLARQAARDNLVAFARLVRIPGVPAADVDEDTDALLPDDVYQSGDTTLATHHILLLNSLQAMVDSRLRYDPETMAPELSWTRLRSDDGLIPGSRWDTCDVMHESQITNGNTGTGIRESEYANPDARTGTDESQDAADPPPPSGRRAPLAEKVSDPSVNSPNPEHFQTCRRIMVMEPPGSAKSTYASVVFPSWDMGRNSGREIILTGWGDPICRRHGKRARQICASAAFREVMGSVLDPRTTAAEDWALVNEATYKSSGIQSGVAGFRCQGLVWDDLTKNRKEADSETIRNDVYLAYLDDARSRKTPSAWEVGIGTRWHEDDTMGRILPEGYAGESGFMRCRDGNVWFVICLAAECERADDPLGREIGEYIWSDWFDSEYWSEKRVNRRSWASLYQQRPAPDEGLYFQSVWFHRYRVLPSAMNYYIAMDPAVTDESDGGVDATSIQVWGVDELARLHLVQDWTMAVGMDVWIETLVSFVRKYKPTEVISESGIIRRASEPFIRRAMIQMKTFFHIEYVTRNADKSAMARPAQAMASSGQVFLPENSMGDDFLDECMRFPTSKKDNRVDAFANLCLRLEMIWAATPMKKAEKGRIIGGEIEIKSLGAKQLSLLRPDQPKSRWRGKYGHTN
jgi:predicted phage terminase large subunit-like protein